MEREKMDGIKAKGTDRGPRVSKLGGVVKPVIVMPVLLIAGLLLVLGTVREKRDFHIDETYSYILSNSYDADRISNEDQVWDRWIDGKRLLEFVSVQEGEGFAYEKVYHNNEKDAHPPLYYFLLHTVCSLFPGQFSQWFGIGINLIFSLASMCLLYRLGILILKDELWALFPPLLWGTSAVFVDAAIFIRMYAMLTFMTLILAILFIKAEQEGITGKRLAALYGVTFLGIFTQYYFAVFAFWATGIFCLYLLRKRRFSKMILLGAVMLAAVVSVFLVYPAGVTQITGSPTNNIGNKVFAGGALFRFNELFGSCVSILRQALGTLSAGLRQIKAATLVYFVIVLVTGIRILRRERFLRWEKSRFKHALVYLAAVGLTFLLVAHISKSFSYLRYVYNIIPLGILGCFAVIKSLVSGEAARKFICFAVMGIAVLNFIGNMVSKPGTYIFRQEAAYIQEITDKMERVPVVMLSERKTYIPTANLTKLIHAEKLYMGSADLVKQFDQLFSEFSTEGVVLYVAADREWAENYDSEEVLWDILQNTSLFSSCEYLGYHDFCDVYYLTTE